MVTVEPYLPSVCIHSCDAARSRLRCRSETHLCRLMCVPVLATRRQTTVSAVAGAGRTCTTTGSRVSVLSELFVSAVVSATAGAGLIIGTGSEVAHAHRAVIAEKPARYCSKRIATSCRHQSAESSRGPTELSNRISYEFAIRTRHNTRIRLDFLTNQCASLILRPCPFADTVIRLDLIPWNRHSGVFI